MPYSSLVFTQGDTPNILYYDGMSDSLRMMSKPTVGLGNKWMWTTVQVLDSTSPQPPVQTRESSPTTTKALEP